MTEPFNSLAETSRALETREISPVEVVSIHIERARATDSNLNCLITITDEEAISASRQAEVEIAKGRYRGPLHGIPFTAKDIFASAGVRTTAGSSILKDWIPTENSGPVQQLVDAGAILIGKANLSEFASGPTNVNEHFGAARNPWKLDRIPGGSSGGSAAAVVAGVGFFSLGTDTGGSVRIPAALTGAFGIKPSFGLSRRDGVIPLSPSLDTVGILARDAADAVPALNALGCLPNSTNTEATPVSYFGLRVGIPKELLALDCDAEIRTNLNKALALIEGDGAEIEEISIPWSTQAASIVNLITWVECAAFHQRWFESRAAMYGRHMREQILVGAAITATQYLQALETRRIIMRLADELFQRVDLIAIPSVSISAPEIAATYDADVLAALRHYSRLASCTGQPALSMPAGFTSDGMPIGLQLIGARYGEEALMHAAIRFELFVAGVFTNRRFNRGTVASMHLHRRRLSCEFHMTYFRLPIAGPIDRLTDYVSTQFAPVFDAISSIVLGIESPIEHGILALPPWMVIVIVALFGFLLGGRALGVLCAVVLIFIISLDLWPQAIATFGLMFTATVIALAVGIPIGVVMGESRSATAVVTPILDFMQTMPAFVLLIPSVLFFGVGTTAGIIATVIYAMPPAVRLTAHGLAIVEKQMVEAGEAFGCSKLRLLWLVKLPLAFRTIMAGVNQCIMMALSMVVIASMIGAGGLGEEIVRAISRLQVGRGVEAGLAVVVLAILL